jgi:hypothetical protein
MNELGEVEFEVLSLLLFAEPFMAIVQESKMAANEYVVADVLKILLHKKLIVSGFLNERSVFEASVFYDSDKMKYSAFKATGRGLEIIEKQGK